MSFRFETILRLNKRKEDLLQKDMGKINVHHQRQQDRLNFMRDAVEVSKDELNQKKKTGVSIEAMILCDNFAKGVKIQVEKQGEIIPEINTKLEVKREEVVEAMRKRRTMEILKERDMLRERKVKEAKETAILDELASNIWARKS